MSVPAVATTGPPPAQARAKSSNAINQGADAIMAFMDQEIGKVTQQYKQEIQDLGRQLLTTISVAETTTAALEQLRKERDNALALAQQATKDIRKAVEDTDGLQRQLQDAAAREGVAEAAARQRAVVGLAQHALLHAHRKDKLARDNLVNKLTSDLSTLTVERDAIRDEKAKAEAEIAAKEKAQQTLRREMDACASRLRQNVARVQMERDAALTEVATMKETATTLQSSVTSLQAERDAARAEVQNKADEAEALRRTQTSFKEAAATAEAERDAATRKLTERLAGFELAAASLTTERDGARAEVQKHLEELSARATRISELEADKAKSSLITDLQEELARQGAMLIQRDNRLSQLKDTYTKTLTKYASLHLCDVLVEDLQKKCGRHLPILAQRDLHILQLNETHAKAIEKLETEMSDEKVRVKRSEEDHKKRLHQRDGTISRMQSSAKRLNTDLASAQSDIERLQSEKQDVEGLLKSAVAERARAEAVVAAHVKQLSEHDSELAKLQDKGRLSKLCEKVKGLESALDARAAKISQLEAEQADADSRSASLIDDQKEKLDRQDAMLSQRDEQISRLKESSAKTRKRSETARTALADEKSRAQNAEEAQAKLLSERDATISKLQTRLDADLVSNISRLESEKQTVEGVLNSVVAQRARAEAAVASYAKLLSERDDQIAKLQDKSELPRVQEKAKSLESALAKANEEKTKLSLKVARLQDEADRLQVSLASVQKSASEQQAADAVLQRVVAERSRAETAVTSLTSERDVLKDRLSTIEAEIMTLREQASTSRIFVLEKNMRERDERITELENAIAASKTHSAHLQSSAANEKSRLEKQLEAANAQSTAAALKIQLQGKSQLHSQSTPEQVSAMQRQVKALTEERDALRKEKVTPAQRAARDEAIEKVRMHIPPQIAALETQVRKLGEERDALQAEALSVEAIMSALRNVGLDFSISDTTFSIGENCVPQLTHLIDLGQKVQEMCQDLSVAQGDLTNDAEATILSLDSLHPFSLLTFLTIVDDWLTAAVATGDGWEKLYREKLQEAVKLREQRNRDKTRVEKTEKLERSLKAKSDEFAQFKVALEKEGIVYDDKTEHGFVFAGKAIQCIKEIAPYVVKVQKTGKAVYEVYPESAIENLLKVPDTNPRMPMGVLKQMKKWVSVAQVVSEAVWAICQAQERELKQAKRRLKDKSDAASSSSTASTPVALKPKSTMPTPLSNRPSTSRVAEPGSSSPLIASSPLADITTRTAKRPSQPMGSSSSARVLEPPKKKRKIQESSSASASTSETKEDKGHSFSWLLGKGGGTSKRPAPESSSEASRKVQRPKPPSSAKQPPPKG
ncbi:hypothetical protein BDZ89DRAFT_1069232 [Hymenopellis radicata]|nr:hypothetical protein BDZ89DRAFT_1069232 [Hymenopellis radicata]